MIPNPTYPNFDHSASEIKKYIEASSIFSILLTNGEIVHHTPVQVDEFREWLTSHKVTKIRKEDRS
jgi:hypothetical protein